MCHLALCQGGFLALRTENPNPRQSSNLMQPSLQSCLEEVYTVC